MNGNRVPWVISIVSLIVALIACLVAVSPRVAAQDDTAPAGPVIAVPVDGTLAVEPALVDPASAEAALGTAITYQGVLQSSGAPAGGSYDFQFQLFNAVTAGTQRGSTLVADNVLVSLGRFSTILNFGNIFGNEALWIAVAVRDGASTGAFTALNPRQSLTAVPFARYAALAGGGESLAGHEGRIKALETLLTGVTSENGGATLRITNRNLQVVSGSGATNGTVNGRGNIIVGYNEVNGSSPVKTGSHNLIVGPGHIYNSYGGVLFGGFNQSLAPFAAVLGGSANIADGVGAEVVGGRNNHASGTNSVIGGGDVNSASGELSAVSGGHNNHATVLNSVVAGGMSNQADGQYAVVSGGTSNTAYGDWAVVSGGSSNGANGNLSVVSGGSTNFANGVGSTIGGGKYITASGVETWSGNAYSCIPNSFTGLGCPP